MNIYICHYTKLLDRYNHVTDELNKYDFSYNFKQILIKKLYQMNTCHYLY